jgi:hypothetical protein
VRIRHAGAWLAASALIAAAVAAGLVNSGGSSSLPPTHLCSGRSFYVDYAGGSDANNGTSTATAWKRAPGMVGFTGTYSHVAHDCFYFKGGVTWPQATMPWEPLGSGNAADRDYYGPKYDWHSGGSWSRPVLDAGGTVITGSCGEVFSGNCDTVLALDLADYLTFDDFEIKNWTVDASCTGNDNCTAIFLFGTGLHDLFDHLYVHAMSGTASAAFTYAKVMAGATFGPPSKTVLRNSIISCTAPTILDGTRAVNYVFNSYISGCIGQVLPSGDAEVSGNTLYDCGYPSGFGTMDHAHADTLQVNPSSGAPPTFTVYIHDNFINGTGSDSNANECELGLIGNPGETDYVWNNLSVNITGNSWALNQLGAPDSGGVAAYFWNNTITGAGDAIGGVTYQGSCLRQVGATWTTIQVRNNHCVTNSGTPWSGLTATTVTNDHNVVRTSAQATADGTTLTESPYAFAPPFGTSLTVDAGADLSSQCTGVLESLCSDTRYGVLVDVNNRVVAPARVRTSRPQGAAWDVGAYER